MAKATDVRPKITLACTECKERNYITKKNRRNDPDRLEPGEVLPPLQEAHRAPRDPLTPASLPRRSRPHVSWRAASPFRAGERVA